MKLSTDPAYHLPGSLWESTVTSPYILRTCAGCDRVDFTTLDLARTRCRNCQGDT